MTTKASTVYGSSSGGVRPNGLQPFSPGFKGVGAATITGINISAGLTTVLSFSGRFNIASVQATSIDVTAGTLRVQVEIDGVLIADYTGAASTISIANIIDADMPVTCQSSFIVRMQKPTALAVNILYHAVSVL